MSLSFLKSHGYTAPSKLLVLTQKGRLAREQYRQLAGAIEESWEKRFGKDTVRTLRESLERLGIKGRVMELMGEADETVRWESLKAVGEWLRYSFER